MLANDTFHLAVALSAVAHVILFVGVAAYTIGAIRSLIRGD
jgi:uncharacterized membrane protein YiaA